MSLSLIASIILPAGLLMAISGGFIYHFSKSKAKTSHEKDLNELTRLWLTGKIDRKTYKYIKESVNAEEIFNNESQKINNLFTNKQLDQIEYIRIKKILQMNLNKRLINIENNAMPKSMQKFLLQQAPN